MASVRRSTPLGDAMKPLSKGRYTVRVAQSGADRAAALTLRGLCFGAAGGVADAFDAAATQVIVENVQTCAIVATFRMALLDGVQLPQSYAAQFYDLSALTAYPGSMLELGRFCIDPALSDPDVLRIAWAALTAYVDEAGIKLLFGCSSFQGTQAAPYLDAFALLKARHLAPARWSPQIKAEHVFDYALELHDKPDLKQANAAMPPLLRTYLMMGGWVSDHAVIDHQMNTLHVFTGLEIGSISPARKTLLRALLS